jgi:hypothetical protein
MVVTVYLPFMIVGGITTSVPSPTYLVMVAVMLVVSYENAKSVSAEYSTALTVIALSLGRVSTTPPTIGNPKPKHNMKLINFLLFM